MTPSDSRARADRSAMLPTCKVLTFHKLLPAFSFGSTNYSPRRFGKLLSFLSRKGYRYSSLAEAIDGRGDKRLVIAFDDGYRHLVQYLPQFIDQYKIRPFVFIPTQHIGLDNTWDYSHIFRNDPHLDKESIKKLAGLGVEFGSHGHGHVALTRLSDRSLEEELRKSKAILEDITGTEVSTISYPFGRYSRRVLDCVARAGFIYGFTMSFPRPDDTVLTIGRLGIYGYDTLFTVGQKVRGGRLYRLEKWKAGLTNRLSGGTILYNRLVNRSEIPGDK